MKEQVNSFLKKYDMHHQTIDIESNCQEFINEMNRGLKGEDSSLKMIPTYIGLEKDIPIDEPVIVMDAGGTNFRVATVYFDKDKSPVIENFKLFSMPGTNGEIGKEEFFKTIADYMEPVLDKSSKIGFCFSYATEIMPNKDGKLLYFCKEVKVKGVEGELIGENLLQAIRKKGYNANKSIVLLNDTVATLLGGKAAYPDRPFDSYIGFILGTGTNTCYIEENKNITKVPSIANTDGAMLINTESGGFSKVPRGKLDIEFDSGTVNPGQYIFEKMISGGYQGGLILTIIKKAAQEGLFSKDCSSRIEALDSLASKEIDDFLYYSYGQNKLAQCCAADEDRLVLYYIIDNMMERAAKLVTSNIAAVILKTGKGTNPCMPVCVTAEGTTFYKSKLFRGKLDYYVKTYLNDNKKVYCDFVKADNATLIGTAIAGLLNNPSA